MTKEEIGKLIDSKKFSKEISCYGDDKFRNLIAEIYYDGMREGYNLAKYRLDLLDKMPFGAADDYLNDNLDKIKEISNLCEQYDQSE